MRHTAVHRTVMVVDVERFGDPARTTPHQVAVRAGLYTALRRAFAETDIPWETCHREDRGDGVVVLAPAEIPKAHLVEAFPRALAVALAEHNQAHVAEERIRLRLALHAGEVVHDEHGVTARAVNLAFRLVDAAPLRQALAASPGVLALIVSDWFFQEVVRHSPAGRPETYRPVDVVAKETSVVGWLSLPDHPDSPDRIRPVSPEHAGRVPRQLPAPPLLFTGRRPELDRLNAALDRPASTMVITAVAGAGGVGKTWLALHWAHQHLDRFPDGQLFADLRGFDPSGNPMPPGTAIRGFLEALGVPPARIPVDLDAQIGLYRSLMADRRMLVVLDNAADTAQVVPLLPGDTDSAVLVTSRRHLLGLMTAHGAELVELDVLTEAESRDLLASRLGTARVRYDPSAVDELIDMCSGLPLALSIVSARAAIRPQFSLRMLVDELANERTRLDALDSGDSTTSVRTVFSWSYQQLDPEAARLFRLLALHPGLTVSVHTAASIADRPVIAVRSVFARLTAAHLVTERTPGRFTIHDLLHRYAAELLATHDNPAECQAATGRMLDHYLYCADLADALMPVSRGSVVIKPENQPAETPPLTTTAEAMTWLHSEHANLIAAAELAGDSAAPGFDQSWLVHAWQLAYTLARFLWLRADRERWLRTTETGLRAVTELGDPEGRFVMLFNLGAVLNELQRHDEAHAHLLAALEISRTQDDVRRQCRALTAIGNLLQDSNRMSDAERSYLEALAISRRAGIRWAEANTCHQLGLLYLAQERSADAAPELRTAITIYTTVAESVGLAMCHADLASALLKTGDLDEALTHAQAAVTLAKEAAGSYHQALTHDRLASVLDRMGARGAIENWQHALALFTELGVPEAEDVRARLDEANS